MILAGNQLQEELQLDNNDDYRTKGKMKTTNKISYGLVIISLLLGSVIAPIPFAVADDDDDKKEKINDLKDKIKKIHDHFKCKKHKYKEICDKKDPDLDITSPMKKDKLPTSAVTIQGTASDEDSGIKSIKIRINHGPYQEVTLLPGNIWKLDTTLSPGKYIVTVKATDWAKNTESERVLFRVLSA